MSKVGGDIWEADVLLSGTREVRTDFENSRHAKRQIVGDAEEKKGRVWEVIVSQGIEENEKCDCGSVPESARKKRRESRFSAEEDEVILCRAALEKGDARRNEVQEE